MNLQGQSRQNKVIETQTDSGVSKPLLQEIPSSASEHHEPRFLRALHVLDAISRSPTGVTLAHLSEQLHIPKATLMRLLQALEDEGYLLRQFDRQAFTLGPAMAGLSLRAMQNGAVAQRYRPVLTQLVQRLGETCNLTASGGDSVVYLDRVETSHPLRMTLATGTRVPLHCTASGKLFLAEMPAQARNALLEQLTLSRMTDQTLCEIQLLKAELERIKRQGYGVDNEEFIRGMVAVAVPVRDLHGHCVAAVACHAPTARYGLGELVAAVGTLRLAATRIADML